MTHKLDPNLRGVLDDITTSRKSALFTGTYLNRLHQAYTIPEGRFAAMRLGMGSAERHLLETYRSELSMVLLQGFYRNFMRVEAFAKNVHNLGEILAAEPLEERARLARDWAPREAFVGKTAHWLRRLLEGRPISTPADFESILTVAIGLRDRPVAWVYMGHVHYAKRDWSGVYRSLEPLLGSAPLACAWNADSLSLLGNSQARAGNWELAGRSFEKGIRAAWALGDENSAVVDFSNLVLYASLVGDLKLPSRLAVEMEGIASLGALKISSALHSEAVKTGISRSHLASMCQRASESIGEDVPLFGS